MRINKIIKVGLKQLGKPYVFNASPHQDNYFDCSSFIQYIFKENGINLPRSSRQQYHVGKAVSYHNIKKGDLLFFTTKKRKQRKGLEKIGHVALYIGNKKILHTFRKGKKVKISSLNSYWKTVLLGAKRVINE